jgi:protein TonB
MLDSSKRSALVSVALHSGAILLVLALTGVKIPVFVPAHEALVMPIEIAAYRAAPAKGGGSGGTHSSTRASIGRPPKPSPHPFTPPLVAPENNAPKLTIEPAVFAAADTKLPTIDLAQFGDIFGAHGPPSNGTGDGGGIGAHHGTGVGDGNGPGFGDGPGGGFGGNSGIDGFLTAPVLLSKTEPEYSEEARRAKIQGTVVLRIEIDQRGQVQNIRVTKGLGLGLDERAVDTVRHWKFRAATRNGRPAVSTALVEVSFRLL